MYSNFQVLSSRSSVLFCLAFTVPALGLAQSTAYIANANDGDVSVVDTATNSVVDTIVVENPTTPPFATPRYVTVSSDGTRFYTSNQNRDDVSVIDTATNTVLDTVAVCDFPQQIAANNAGTLVYVACQIDSEVSVIDATSLTEIDSISTLPATGARALAVSPDDSRLYVGTIGDSMDEVHVIDTSNNMIIDSITVGDNPQMMAINPQGTRLYVNTFSSGDMAVIDTTSNTLVTTVALGSGPQGVAVNLSGSLVYVALQNEDVLKVIDAATNLVIDTIDVGDAPNGVAITDDALFAYVTNIGMPDDVSVVDLFNGVEISDFVTGDSPTSLGDFLTPDPSALFRDGFESGDATAWSAVDL